MRKYIFSGTRWIFSVKLGICTKSGFKRRRNFSKRRVLPWCWPPNETKLFILGSGQRWATARLWNRQERQILSTIPKENQWILATKQRKLTEIERPARIRWHCSRLVALDRWRFAGTHLRLVCSGAQSSRSQSLRPYFGRFELILRMYWRPKCLARMTETIPSWTKNNTYRLIRRNN